MYGRDGQYLVGLRKYYCTIKGGDAFPKLGTSVLIIDTIIERRFWKFAKITSYIKGEEIMLFQQLDSMQCLKDEIVT